jgi:phosphopantothenoylcysteine decarboxylase/phosphopantothenate--cysteine ligase
MEFSFKGKKILLGVTGSIAAYKSPLLVRELIKAGAEVNVIMTPSSVNFVTPMVLSNLSRNPVWIEMFDESAQRGGAWHIQTAHECDAMIIAPASATTIGKLANGICDNALVTIATALPKNIPLLIAPAMDFTMLDNPATQKNIKQLSDWGYTIIPPDEGQLSSGLTGRGRLPDTKVLMDYIQQAIIGTKKEFTVNEVSNNEPSLNQEIKTDDKNQSNDKQKLKDALEKSVFNLQDGADKTKWQADLEFELLKSKFNNTELNILKNKKVIITAGPTIEKIDEVRFISNFSSGKMGYALAETCKNLGMNVTLISGKVNLEVPNGIKVINVISADEMYERTIELKNDYDIAILSAAVADYTPKNKFEGKIKKDSENFSLNLELEKTKDILSELGKAKKENQILVGFALEFENEIENGWKKLKDKKCNFIVLNSVNKPDSGFGGDMNTITLLNDKGQREDFEPMSKISCSVVIMNSLSNYIKNC